LIYVKIRPPLGSIFLFCYLLRIKKQLLVPQGFAHGFQYLAKPLVLYKCDQYNKESEGGIRFDDSALEIDWEWI
jgi:dTDP-4-dehydrorhamnose 3,5-epimerase